MKNFELEKLKFEREQLKLALDNAVNALDLKTVRQLIEQLGMEPAELKELQAKTSQLPNLYKKDPTKHAAAKQLADAINADVTNTRHDKSDQQQGFLQAPLLHKMAAKKLNLKSDDMR